MILPKAKEVITDIIHARASARTPNSMKALKIGREAIDRLQELRANPRLYPIEPLPSETKD